MTGWGFVNPSIITAMNLRQVALQIIDENDTRCINVISNGTLHFCATVADGLKGRLFVNDTERTISFAFVSLRFMLWRFWRISSHVYF